MNNEGNNSVNPTNNTTTNSNQPVLKPMEGVRVAPVSDSPVNASNSSTATSSVSSIKNDPFQNGSQPQITNSTVTPITNTQSTPQTQPVIVNTPPTGSNIPPVVNGTLDNNGEAQKKPKKKSSIVPILILIIIILIGYTIYNSKLTTEKIARINYECTPITASKEVELDLDSSLVKSLYSKVKTNIIEDLAQPEFNDNMRIYLAYRQVLETDKYDSNCNLFSTISMEPYVCKVNENFQPLAFKEDVLKIKLKELFGERTDIPLQNVRLGINSCVGGYQYIPERGEFVQGYCKESNASIYKVEKKLIKATSTKNTIILTEDTRYIEGEGLELPKNLKSGYYNYTFRLDMNYNYVLVSKTYKSKY